MEVEETAPGRVPSAAAAADVPDHRQDQPHATLLQMDAFKASSGGNGVAMTDDAAIGAASADDTYQPRDLAAAKEEEAGALQFRVVRNDGLRHNMIWLMQAKNLFATQLPKMPREYITRLVFDRKHRSLLAIKNDRVVGGICFRPFVPQRFAEVAFLAVTSSEQIKGYGTRLMNHLKEAVKMDGLTHFLTYADNYAIGYFRKQGFTKSISMVPERWLGYIKDYDGGTLMECIIYGVDYLNVLATLKQQKARALAEIEGKTSAAQPHAGLDFSAAATGGDADFYIKHPDKIPGLAEAGYDCQAVAAGLIASRRPSEGALRAELLTLVDELISHDDSWPFREKVDRALVPDYYVMIKNPIDLGEIKERVLGRCAESKKYKSRDHFSSDVALLFANCRRYNRPDTEFVACANKLEPFFKARLRALAQKPLAAAGPQLSGDAPKTAGSAAGGGGVAVKAAAASGSGARASGTPRGAGAAMTDEGS